MEREFSQTVTPPTDALTHEKIEPTDNSSAESNGQIRECFDMFDINQDGRISADELATMTRALGQNPTDTEVQDMINEVDNDGNGYIDWPEFLQLMKNRVKSKETEVRNMIEAFKVFDRDGNGTIDMQELKLALTQSGEKMSDSEVQEMFEAADINHDGLLDYSEFVELMCGGSIFDRS